MQNFTCDLCKEVFPIEEAVGFKQSSRKENFRGSSASKRCRVCNTAHAKAWRQKNPGYRGSGKLKAVPQEDRLLMSAIRARIQNAKGNSKRLKHSVPIAVTAEYLYELFKSQAGCCALSGVQLKIEVGAITCLSLDKIDPVLGYVEGNVQWVAWAINRAKGDLTTEVFLDMCKKVYEYGKVQRLSKSAA